MPLIRRIKPPGYHLRPIPKRPLGSPLKIFEEVTEFRDALLQKNPIMAIQELSDLIGAIKSYLHRNHPSIKIRHLIHMSNATKRAFDSGQRK